ncbi:MAG: type I DNA topoisomerase [Bacteroidales bacterium]|jgi:DNA topoisomerase-1|nr:type I DNA topoisomerase [Bacteroidales bacterium]
MVKNLVIVESPAKAKTIGKFLGKDFEVMSSQGHIRDLASGDNAVDVENGFKPHYEEDSDAKKQKLISSLKSKSKEADIVWLASDEDREGEAIAWHLKEVLELPNERTKRIVFHEITKKAILDAIENPREININLVDAQQARRILDRLVGYELSPVLWRKVRRGLSAGRVQSVALRLIVDREEEIRNFTEQSAFKTVGTFEQGGEGASNTFNAELNKRFDNAADAEKFLQQAAKATFTVNSVEVKPMKRMPAPPFTTSTLQQEASRKLGYSVSQTMRIAQHLYESGYITYMRTDSVTLSAFAVNAMRETIDNLYGGDYARMRQFPTKSKGAQEAHEAIRPTYFDKTEIDGDQQEKRLYDLIWKRTVASQMAEAVFEKTDVTINVSERSEQFIARGEVLKFDGFLKVYMEGNDDDEASEGGNLPELKQGQELDMQQAFSRQAFTQHPPRYSEASLVKKMEEVGIGRPSTYAPTISTIMAREYVVKQNLDGTPREYTMIVLKDGKIAQKILSENTGAEKGKLFPTDTGTLVTRFLVEYFPDILDYNFTADVEEEFDEVAKGQKQWQEMLGAFYEPFHKQVEKTEKEADYVRSERVLGNDPVSGEVILTRLGKFGPLVQKGEGGDDKKPQFANLKKGQSIETITLEEALDLFRLPRVAGTYEGKELKVATGKFGPYVLHDGLFVSIPKTDDPLTIEQDRAIELVEAKRKANREKLIKDFGDVQVLNGRWGAYIAKGKENFRIPKGTDAAALTEEEVLAILSAAVANEAKPAAKSAAKSSAVAAKKTSAKSAAAKKTATKKATAKKATEKSAAKKTSAKSSATKKTTAKKATVKSAAVAKKKTAVTKKISKAK